MIFDKLENISRYFLPESFTREILEKSRFVKGKFDLNQQGCFGIGLEYYTQDQQLALWEAHRKYLDIHILLKGEEIISIADITNAESTQPYEDDYELFNASSEQTIHLTPRHFLILFPNEVHRTTVSVHNSVLIQKFVYKYGIHV